jgi:Leucine-rich repeat (LRR) protein
MDTVLQRIQEMGPDGFLLVDRLWLDELPPLPPTLKTLVCSRNQLTSLPQLPTGLKSLTCWANELTSLPPLPPALKILDCCKNQLTSLPALPKNLESLTCYENNLTRLPALPPKLKWLQCHDNQLRRLPRLPESLEEISCDKNPFEKPLKQIVDIYSMEVRRPVYMMDPVKKRKLVQQFIKDANQYLDRKENLKRELIEVRYHPNRIQRHMDRNQINMEGYMSEENWEKYFVTRGEVTTQGVGTSNVNWNEYFPNYPVLNKGGKRNTKRRASKKRITLKRKRV